MIQPIQRLAITTLVFGLALGAAAQDVWTGGVSAQERGVAPDYNTRVQFFTDGGPYLANVDYVLYDEAGNRMKEGTADGPWLMVDLDAGTYSVKATRHETGETQSTRFFYDGDGRITIGLKFNE